MKAALYRRYGGADVVEYADIVRPVPGAGEVLVKVAGTSFNPVDSGIRGGYLTDAFPISFPHVPGIDVAGTVAEVGVAGVGCVERHRVVNFRRPAARAQPTDLCELARRG